MAAPTVSLERPPSPEDFARALLLAAEACDCTREQRAGVAAGSEAHCLSCEARRLLNELAELVDGR